MRTYYNGDLDPGVCAQFVENVDVVLTAETFYGKHLPRAIRYYNRASRLYAMPELYQAEIPNTRVAVPTAWNAPPGADILPWPYEPLLSIPARTGPVKMAHVGAEAMLDREGTRTLIEAVRRTGDAIAYVDDWDKSTGVLDWRTRYTTLTEFFDQVDVLIQPRRYAGLSLLAHEAINRGVALVHPLWSPYAHLSVIPLQRSEECELLPMKGGPMPVCNVDTTDLANVLVELRDRDLIELWRTRTHQYALTNSWKWKRDDWLDWLNPT